MTTPLFLKALAKEQTPRPPIWFMRQAGRFLPEYRAIREKHTFNEVMMTPALSAEVTLQPIRRFGFDASILFSDILVVPMAMGQKLEFGTGHGPMLSPPIETMHDVERLKEIDAKTDINFGMEAVQRICEGFVKEGLGPENDGNIPLIGFAGAPFTVACYMIEGQGSKNWLKVKTMMRNKPEVFAALLTKLERATADYLDAQVDAGCRAIQLFDSWAGTLTRSELQDIAVASANRVFTRLRNKATPRIYFAKGVGSNLDCVLGCDANAYGIDWQTELSYAQKTLSGKALQGNLDPAYLFSDQSALLKQVEAIKQQGMKQPGYIFNLGHGILPKTPIENVTAVVKAIQQIG